MTRPPGSLLEQMTATKTFDLNGYGNKTAIGGPAFKLTLHIIVQKRREGNVK